MNLKIISFLMLLFLVYSCKTNRIINGKKEGKWILTDVVNNDVYKYIEKYKKGEEVKKWKTYKNKKIYRTEKYKAKLSHVTFFYENGKKRLEGNSKLIESVKESHWFYIGEWKMYDETGKLIGLKNYEEGILISEIEVK